MYENYLKYVNNGILKKIVLVYTIFFIPISIIFYNVLPWVLNYPQETVGGKFQIELEGVTYIYQYISIIMLSYLLSTLVFYVFFKRIYISKIKNDNDVYKYKERLVKFPGQIYTYQMVVPIVSLCIIHPLTIRGLSLTTLKLVFIIGPMIVFLSTFIYIYIKKIISDILKNISDGNEIYQNKEDILKKGVKELLPIFFALIILIVMVSYSIYIKERGKLLNNVYSERFDKAFESTEYTASDIKQKLNSIQKLDKNDHMYIYNISKDSYEIIDNNDNTKISKYFTKYMNELSENRGGIVYEYYGNNYQGYAKMVNIDGMPYYIGVRYNVGDSSIIFILVVTGIISCLIYVVIFYNYSKFNKGMFAFLLDKFRNIEGKSKEEKKDEIIPIISNDEFGELTLLYNNLSKMTNEYIENLKSKQDIIVKQGQLASIGELAGGVAHDINTPISAIKSGILMFREMLGERSQDEMELLQRMDNCADKIINIVNSMRNQMRNLGGDTKIDFKISDVLNDIKIIAYNEISKHGCKLEINIEDDLSVNGDPTKLGQVLTNLVVNGVQAYKDKTGIVNVHVTKAPNNMAMIKVTDYAGGIDESIKPFIFKNMLTTKGTVGTGFGLYLAYSVIKGIFGGDITFESEKGMGTTFYVTIPRV
ncbi:MAG: HAMP domain-containing histidine kinase [Clostridia bacterium]|nr:HAMP domain-containing histidine kinase [Clostridia bacterium]